MRTLLDETPSAQSLASPPPVAGSAQRLSQWHSPVPYLFGGLAATLGLIALTLLILACSYWNVSGNPGVGGGEEAGDAEKGEKVKEVARVYEEQIVVIMAGDERPTYLAMPVSGQGRSSISCDWKNVDQETRKEASGFGSKINEDGNNNCSDEVADHQHHHHLREVQESQ